MGLPGKPKGFDGGEVERYFREGKIKEVADYCETDVLGTYQVWLRYELFRGTLSQNAFQASQRNLADFMNARTGVPGRSVAGKGDVGAITAAQRSRRHRPTHADQFTLTRRGPLIGRMPSDVLTASQGATACAFTCHRCPSNTIRTSPTVSEAPTMGCIAAR